MFGQLKVTKQKNSNFSLVDTIIETNKKNKKHREIVEDLTLIHEKEKLEQFLIENKFYVIEDFDIITGIHEEYNPDCDIVNIIISFITGYQEVL